MKQMWNNFWYRTGHITCSDGSKTIKFFLWGKLFNIILISFFTIVFFVMISCSQEYKSRKVGYIINSKGDTCLPCKRGYYYENDTCHLIVPKANRLYW